MSNDLLTPTLDADAQQQRAYETQSLLDPEDFRTDSIGEEHLGSEEEYDRESTEPETYPSYVDYEL